jgi:predicted DCC family thiol-disulfide oxidoreductase YuxK
MEAILSAAKTALTVYFDGSCPLCRAEVSHYRGQIGASRLCFRDVSRADQPLEPDLTRADAMSRFHVRRGDGQLVSGAAAFVSIWSELPRWRWAARLAAIPGVMKLLEGGYRLFLPTRPALAWIFRKSQASRQRWQIVAGATSPDATIL